MEQADRHRLYELSVQNPKAEIDFLDATFHELRGRIADKLREDFCGTANVCAEWVQRRKTNRAIGVDLDKAVLTWGRRNRLSTLKPRTKARVSLLRANVLEVESGPCDIIVAMNFSYWLFKRREQLLRYFQRVRTQLNTDGIFFLDSYGGYDAFREMEEKREVWDGDTSFNYVWEQERYDPISGEQICHIHFEFADGSRLERAFSYNWRLWTLPETRELLAEAGFSRVIVYWQKFDDNDQPTGEFYPAERGEADASWICYIAALK